MNNALLTLIVSLLFFHNCSYNRPYTSECVPLHNVSFRLLANNSVEAGLDSSDELVLTAVLRNTSDTTITLLLNRRLFFFARSDSGFEWFINGWFYPDFRYDSLPSGSIGSLTTLAAHDSAIIDFHIKSAYRRIAHDGTSLRSMYVDRSRKIYVGSNEVRIYRNPK